VLVYCAEFTGLNILYFADDALYYEEPELARCKTGH